jgi:ppGpp synthetase/RelA/SpoT-type nucleotidyltranferase
MSNNQQLRDQYEQCKPKYKNLKDAVVHILKKEIGKRDIPYSDIDGRVKTFESFQKKVEDKEYKKPFEETEDICGLRIVCLFPADLHKIGNLIEETFYIIKKEDKIFDNPPESFGYMSIHYIAILHESYKGAHYDDLKNLKFEIQLRTIAAHAWCSVSHHLDYKNPAAVTKKIRTVNAK